MLDILLALLPFFLIAYLLVVRGVSALHTLFFAFLYMFVLLFVWGQPVQELFFALLKGSFITFDLLLIIFGVLFLFYVLQETKHMEHLELFLSSLSKEIPVHIVLIGYFFVFFLEGIAGFGTPALIAAPLLILVGVRPLTAVVVCLVTDSLAVVFGAFGTPIFVGLAGISGAETVVTQITAVLAGAVMVFLPTLLLFLYSSGEGISFRKMYPYLPLSFVSGIVSALLFITSAYFLGPEFPSVITAVFGLAIVIFFLRRGVLGVSLRKPRFRLAIPSLSAYLLIIALLIVTRIDLFGLGSFALSLGGVIVLSQTISHTFSFYAPGVLITLSALLFVLFIRPKWAVVRSSLVLTKEKLLPVGATLLFTLFFAQLIMYSSPSIPELVASLFAGTSYGYLFFAPLIGAFGSFIAGSATVSNLLFASVHIDAAVFTDLSPSLILALQVVGAGIGNMLAIHNIIAVLAVVHVKGGIRTVLLHTSVIALFLIVVVSILSLGFL